MKVTCSGRGVGKVAQAQANCRQAIRARLGAVAPKKIRPEYSEPVTCDDGSVVVTATFSEPSAPKVATKAVRTLASELGCSVEALSRALGSVFAPKVAKPAGPALELEPVVPELGATVNEYKRHLAFARKVARGADRYKERVNAHLVAQGCRPFYGMAFAARRSVSPKTRQTKAERAAKVA